MAEHGDMYAWMGATLDGGAVDLPDASMRIDRLWAAGRLTEADREELMAKARELADPNLPALADRVAALEVKVAALEAKPAAAGAGGDDGEWPAYAHPTGAHDVYAAGARVTFEGARYTSLIDANSWSPSEYPAGWRREA